MNNKEAVDQKIKDLMEELNGYTPGSDEYESVVRSINTLSNTYSSLSGSELALAKADLETRMAEEKAKDDKKNRIVDVGLKVVGGIATAAVTIWGVLFTANFEKEDMTTTTAGKQAFRDTVSGKWIKK